jgi:hypothetical protein
MSLELTAPTYANTPEGPWTLAIRLVEIRTGQNGWRVQAESPTYKYGPVTAMTYLESDYEKALSHFEKLKDTIDLSVPADAERHARCTYCNSITTMRAFFSILPWRDHDDDYCGCRGWD